MSINPHSFNPYLRAAKIIPSLKEQAAQKLQIRLSKLLTVMANTQAEVIAKRFL